MKKQINDLLLKMQTGENCIGETANALLILCSVSNTLTDKEKIDYEIYAKREESNNNLKGWLAAFILTVVIVVVGFNMLKWLSS